MSWKSLYLLGCLFIVLPVVTGQDQCMELVREFYQETPLDVNKPDSSTVVEVMGDSFFMRPLASIMVLFNQSAIACLENGAADSLFSSYSGVVFLDTIIYGKQSYRQVKGELLGSGCDGIEKQNDSNATFFRIESLSEDIMQEALGIIVFDACFSMRSFQEDVQITDSCGWELPLHIPQHEEITKRKALVLKVDSKQVMFLKTGVRYGSEDIEYLYSNIIDVKYIDKILRMGYLSNSQCLEGYYYGF